jgi:hypothetical protein
VLDRCGLRRLVGSSSPLLPASGMGAAGLDRTMAAILGFLSCQDEDLSDGCLHRSGCSGVFPKANSCLEIAGSGGIRSCAPMFSLTVWFQRERIEALLVVNIIGHVLVPCCLCRMSWEPRSKDQQKVVRVWVVMRNWLGDL